MRRSLPLAVLAAVMIVAIAAVAAQRGPQPTPAASDLESGLESEAAGGERGTASLDPAGAQALSAPTTAVIPAVSRKVDLKTLGGERPVRGTERPEPGDPATPALSAPSGGSTSTGVSTAAVAAPSPGSVWAGLSLSANGCGWPPDTNGDVSAAHYVQSVNCSVGIWDKAGTRKAAMTLNDLIDGTKTLCDTNNFGDPVVVYDTQAKRWIVTDFAFTYSGGRTTSQTFECVAVSKTDDPVTGGWTFYAFPVSNTGDMADYPKVGVWPNGIYLTFNLFGSSGSFKNVRVLSLNKDDLYAGVSARSVQFDLPQRSGGTTVFSLLPSNARVQSGLPAASAPNLLASIYGSYAVRVWKFTPNWTTLSSSTISGPTSVSTGTFNVGPSTAPTPKNANDTLTYRLMMQNQYTNIGGKESLWVTHTVGVSSVAAPAWYQLNVDGGTVSTTLRQKGTYAPGDGVHRYTPSLAVDKNGDMALGYTASKSTLHPSLRYATRLAGDPAGTLGSEATLFAGTGSQTYTNRWGDYSAMSLDPDGCTFWFTSEAYDANGSDWQTKIGSFRLSSCS